MSKVVKKVARVGRSILGDTVADMTDPVGGKLVAKEDQKAMEARLAGIEAGQQAAGEAPKAETLMTATEMPAPEGFQTRAARRKAISAQVKRRGRQSTILTGDTLGTAG